MVITAVLAALGVAAVLVLAYVIGSRAARSSARRRRRAHGRRPRAAGRRPGPAGRAAGGPARDGARAHGHGGGRHGGQAGRREAGRHDDERHPPARPAHHRLREAGRGPQRPARAPRRRRHAAPPRRRPAARPAPVAGSRRRTSSTRALAETTAHLREALASPKARGQWGERMADDVLRLAGMVEGVTYRKQTGIAGGAIPDVTFLLPGGRHLHMDVKFPVDNYLRHLEAGTDAERELHAKAFLRDVRGRVKELSGRGYIDADATLDEVLLFIPNESVWAFIHERDPQLIDVALAAEGRAVLAGEPVRGAGRDPPGRRADPPRPHERRDPASAWPASASSGRSSPRPSTSWSSASTPPSAASRRSPARGGASSSASSTASRTCGPAAGCPSCPPRAGRRRGRGAPPRQRRRAPLGHPRGRLSRQNLGTVPAMRWIDDHCHLHRDLAQADAQVAAAAEAGVERLITVGCDVSQSADYIEIARRHPGGCGPPSGVHPHDAKDGIDGMEALLGEPEVVAVGECGLDFHYDHSPRDQQAEVFAAQIALAHAHDLALVIHTREAWPETFDILAAEGRARAHGVPLLHRRPRRGSPLPRPGRGAVLQRHRQLPVGHRPARRRPGVPARPAPRRDRQPLPGARCPTGARRTSPPGWSTWPRRWPT